MCTYVYVGPEIMECLLFLIGGLPSLSKVSYVLHIFSAFADHGPQISE